MAEYPDGTPSWIELQAPDTAAAAAFYTALFGWTAGEAGPAESGGYRMFLQDGLAVAGLSRPMRDGHPAAWATYIAVDDADATAARVTTAGGRVLAPAMDVMDLGRMAIFADPGGAVFGIWQAREFGGAEVVNVPNSLCWNDVLTRDKPAALEFYPAVFGWTATAPDFDPSGGYTVWQRPDGRAIGGMTNMTEQDFPAELPPHWAISFAVADADATAARATELGATATMALMDCPIGRFGGFVDPLGASFAIMALAEG